LVWLREAYGRFWLFFLTVCARLMGHLCAGRLILTRIDDDLRELVSARKSCGDLAMCNCCFGGSVYMAIKTCSCVC